ncbi:hypothetical protein [Anaplasma phagocytophilum]|uniref:hypothetical protein n=1 Tax=Anaplasma phagocytophilum TaxID=948 RepID=UPI000A9283A8|nr:hypothetical protein [Anaplasma phagocytophilum]
MLVDFLKRVVMIILQCLLVRGVHRAMSSYKPYHKVTFCNLESKDLVVVIRGL